MPHHRVCPWWIGYLLASPIRRLTYNPTRLLQPYVRAGMTVLEPGPGMGFFTLDLARLVGEHGRVIAVDIQPKMLRSLRRRAVKAGLGDRIETRLAKPDSMGIADLADRADFALAFAVVHEMPSARVFFGEVAQALKPGARVLLAEPAGHVTAPDFEAEIAAAAEAGLRGIDRPSVPRALAAMLEKAS
jgi:SAM-dependent methyltransferase